MELLDRQAAESQQYNYLLRKAIGKSFMEAGRNEAAIKQLQLAVELQPNDRGIHDALVACFDATDNKLGAAHQFIELLKLNPRELTLYSQLGNRLKDDTLSVSEPDGAERAFTSMVEMLPTETEGHVELANIRQQQDRWDEAILHWRRVAELRKNEPAGLIGLGKAQIHQALFDDAKATLKQLKTTPWPERFDDLLSTELSKLQESLESSKGSPSQQ